MKTVENYCKRLTLSHLYILRGELSIARDFANLFERGFEVFNDFLSEHVGNPEDSLSLQNFQRLERFELLNSLNGRLLNASCVDSQAFIRGARKFREHSGADLGGFFPDKITSP
jgi:hypothetical protein